MRHALNAKRRCHQQKEYDNMAFVKRMRALADQLNMPSDMLKRCQCRVSGWRKKRLEPANGPLEPKLAILDETDSGLDIDALKIVSEGVNALRNAQGFFGYHPLSALVKLYYSNYVHILEMVKLSNQGLSVGPSIGRKGLRCFCP